MKKTDILIVVVTVILLAILIIPTYLPKGCEVARADYTCATLEQVIYENCNYLNAVRGHNNSEIEIRWYIQQLCGEQNSYHGTVLDCSNVDSVCSSIISTNILAQINNTLVNK